MFLLLLTTQAFFGQELKPFAKRFNASVNGDILVIGNNILNRDSGTAGNRANDPYDALGTASVSNESTDMKWINIDPDAGRNFNSSSAVLIIPTSSSQACYNIVYAGLYWSGMYTENNRNAINKVKIKVPGGVTYKDLTGTVIYDYTGSAIADATRNPYACFVDITASVKAAKGGTYTVANVACSEGGLNTAAGHSAGWSMFVVYEDPNLPRKYISSYDGFTRIRAAFNSFTIPVDGFHANNTGSVVAKIAFTALEGDNVEDTDGVSIQGIAAGSSSGRLFCALRPASIGTPNFFNSTINDGDTYFTDRNPNSKNTLGFDTGVVQLDNPGNSVLKNDETGANITFSTSSNSAISDGYYLFFTAMAVETAEPKIKLTKLVQDGTGNDIGNTPVTLGQVLNYVLRFQNTGNDNATQFTIRDVIPVNTIFNSSTDLVSLPPGVTASYTAATRELIFTVNNSVVEVGDGPLEIRFKVQVVPDCSMFSNACSNSINNTAYITYKGDKNTAFSVSNVPSVNSDAGCLVSSNPTNFLVKIDDCKFEKEIVLCGNSVTLKAADNYDSYFWNPTPNGVIKTNQTLTVRSEGTYYVHDTATSSCVSSIDEKFTVIDISKASNPVIPFADDIKGSCQNDGRIMPKINLCGQNAARLIKIFDGTRVVWEKLDGVNGANCVAMANSNCPSENTATCTWVWTQVGTGSSYLANTAGQFRLTITYPGNCKNIFYFNVYKNSLNPTYTSKDIMCSTPGNITVASLPDYEYSLNDELHYQDSNIFTITSPNIHTVYIRQKNVLNGCVFTIPGIQIRQRNLTVNTITTQPLCNGNKGAVKLVANGVDPQYSYSIYDGATLVNSAGPTEVSDCTFKDLNGGTYTVNVSAGGGCPPYTGTISIINPSKLNVTASLTQPLTCNNGEIMIYPVGGTPNYYYYVNNAAIFQDFPQIAVAAPGNYSIRVVDKNGCTATTTASAISVPKPEYTIDSSTTTKCYEDNSGMIRFNVTNANGYRLEYSIDGGATYSTSATFLNLMAGTYNPKVRYTLGTSVCEDTITPITITQPTSSITATAGVAELAGCGNGPGIPKSYGKVRITNAQGGVPPYLYSFDGGNNYISLNEAYVAPGNYTLYAKDDIGCIYPMPGIILDPEPVPPTISDLTPVYNCDGTANSSATVTNSPNTNNYNISYFLDNDPDPNTNVPPNVFMNIASGSHTIHVKYSLKSVPTYSNLLNENFGYGEDTSSPGINTSFYCWEKQLATDHCKTSTRIEDGDYTVTSHIVDPYITWVQPGDHTAPTVPAKSKGRFLVVNIGDQIPIKDVLYEKVINDIIPNQPINFELYIMNLIKAALGNTKEDVSLKVALVHPIDGEISSFVTGEIPKTEKWEVYPKTPITLDPKTYTSLKFIIRSNKQDKNGNDVAIDDIKVYQMPKSCIAQKDFPIEISDNMGFKAEITGHKDVTCNDAGDGEITITVENFDPAPSKGFYYSMDDKASWTKSFTSPLVLKNLEKGTYDKIYLRYAVDKCVLGPLSQEIQEPDLLVASGTIKTPVKCPDGATIEASATGGTKAYQYQLRDGTGIIRVYQRGNLFINVPAGSYVIQVKDANGCTDDSDTIVVDGVDTPTASLGPASDLCFDTVNQATLIVDVTGGKPPYTYSLDGAAAQTDNTFTHVSAGSHSIIVTDSNGCTSPALPIVIALQLYAGTTTKGFECSGTATPADAVITVNISGGTPSFKYKVKKGSGAFGSDIPITGSSFTYNVTTGNADTYTFEITDNKGCTASTTATVNSLIGITATPTVTNLSCNGSANGSVTIDASGGVPPYTYSFDGSLFTTNATYSGLAASTLPLGFHYKVKDTNNCVFDGDVVVTQPAAITFDELITDISCTRASILGSIELQSLANGVASFTYTLTNTVTNAAEIHYDLVGGDFLFGGLSFGTYNLTVTDSKSCSVTKTLSVSAPPNDLDIDLSTPVATCAANATIIVSVNQSSIPAGTLYTFGIYDMIGVPVSTSLLPNDPGFPLRRTFTGLTPGVVYTFVVYDRHTGCYYFEKATGSVPPLTSLTCTIDAANPVCGASPGSVSFTISDYTGINVGYEIFHDQTNVSTGITGTINTGVSTRVNNVGAFTPGVYYIKFTELDGTNVGCSSAPNSLFTIKKSPIALSGTAWEVKKDNCKHTGQISASAQGGTVPYEYELVGPKNIPYSTYAYFPNPSLGSVSLTGGNYTVNIKDNNGCTVSATVFLDTDPSPGLVASITANQCTATEGNFAIDVSLPTLGIAPHSFSIDGGSFQIQTAPFTITNLSSGLHTIAVHDFNGCGNQASVTILPPLELSATITKLPSCSNNDGIITVGASGGTGAYSYSIIPNPVAPIPSSITLLANVFSGIPAGTYDVTITDTTTNCPKTVTVPVEAATPITGFQLHSTPVACYGDSNGSITGSIATPTAVINNNPLYTYSLISLSGQGITRPAQPSTVFDGLSAGNYTVTVTSGRGCSESSDITVDSANSIVVPAPVETQYRCNAGSNLPNYASIVIGNPGDFTRYEFIKGGTIVQSGSSNIYTQTDLSGGNFTINVYDAQGCPGNTVTATIDPFISIGNPRVNVKNIIICSVGEEIEVQVDIAAGSIPAPLLVYTVRNNDGSPGQTISTTSPTATFTGLLEGDYTITVLNRTTGCSVVTHHHVNNPNTFDLQVTKNSDVICLGSNEGNVKLTLVDTTTRPITGGFSYTIYKDAISPPGTVVSSGTVSTDEITISGLVAGRYTAKVISSSQCPVYKGFTIDGPSVGLTISETHSITCTPRDGSISVFARGGWSGGYEYQLESVSGTIISSWSTKYEFTGLDAGNYRVRVKDSKGCPGSVDVNLLAPNPITIAASVHGNLNCFGDTSGEIRVNTTTGGQGSNYMYILNTISVTPNVSSAPQSLPIFGNLGAGTYTVSAIDGFGYSCTRPSPQMVITQPNEVIASLQKSIPRGCVSRASLQLSATGGTGPYRYSIDGITYSPVTFTASTPFVDVLDGKYSYYVRDAKGCTSNVSNEITIEPVDIDLIFDNPNPEINCNGQLSGVIVATAIGGVGNYRYTLLDGVGSTLSVTQTTPAIFTGLSRGLYKVKVESGTDCSKTKTVIIFEPSELKVDFTPRNVLCNGNRDGQIQIEAIGGTPIIKYAISPNLKQFVEEGFFNNLEPDIYTVIAQDNKGCYNTKAIPITQPDAINADSTITQQEKCDGDKTGAFGIVISGGIAPYTFSLDNQHGDYSPANGNNVSFTGQSGGDHIVYIKDSNECQSEKEVELNDAIKLNPMAATTYDCVNNLPANIVTVTIDPSNTNPSLIKYSLDGTGVYQNSNLFINVPPGVHFVVVQHANDCKKPSEDFKIKQIEPLTISIDLGGLNEIVATAAGGSGIYQYSVNGDSLGSVNKYIYYKTGDYTFTVTDTNGCEASATKHFDFIDIDIPNIFTPNGSGTNDNWTPTKTENYPNIKFVVYDRYGREVGRFGTGQSWNGKYNGKELPTGDYWYILKLNNVKDDREFVGHFTLYR